MYDFRLRVFMTMAQEKTFTRAATRLGGSQPTVSNNVSELEKELGVKLFIRTSKGIRPPANGKMFIDRLRHLLYVIDLRPILIPTTFSLRKLRLDIDEHIKFLFLRYPALRTFDIFKNLAELLFRVALVKRIHTNKTLLLFPS